MFRATDQTDEGPPGDGEQCGRGEGRPASRRVRWRRLSRQGLGQVKFYDFLLFPDT